MVREDATVTELYAFDDEDVKIIDMACGEELPKDVVDAINDPDIIKSAWNAQFERTCLSKYFGTQLSPDSWQCSMVWAASLSLPLKLATAAEVLKTGEQKDDAGERLIKYFSVTGLMILVTPGQHSYNTRTRFL